jgi:TusA-related sulfurtransferase
MERLLDVRALEPPEPLERVLDALADMPADHRLRVVLGREPYPLYGLLRRMGYCWRTEAHDGRYEILIWSGEAPPGRRAGTRRSTC